ncbi:MAG TPA: hypothetical protein VFV64_13540 [Permianibacter sp.]|nr:hypothetical protein [Permianibacter sp.]
MRTSALILLLIAMLAPRLTAALPHALVCASTGSPAVTSTSVAADHADAMPGAHHGHHQMMMAADDSGMAASPHSHHAPQQIQPHHADAPADSANAGQDCQHCGQCDEHCSAVVVTALPQQQARPGAEHPLSANAGQRAGFSHDLNRPPRTASL